MKHKSGVQLALYGPDFAQHVAATGLCIYRLHGAVPINHTPMYEHTLRKQCAKASMEIVSLAAARVQNSLCLRCVAVPRRPETLFFDVVLVLLLLFLLAGVLLSFAQVIHRMQIYMHIYCGLHTLCLANSPQIQCIMPGKSRAD